MQFEKAGNKVLLTCGEAAWVAGCTVLPKYLRANVERARRDALRPFLPEGADNGVRLLIDSDNDSTRLLPTPRELEEGLAWVKFADLARDAAKKHGRDEDGTELHLVKTTLDIVDAFNIHDAAVDARGMAQDEATNFSAHMDLHHAIDPAAEPLTERDEATFQNLAFEDALSTIQVTSGIIDAIQKHNSES